MSYAKDGERYDYTYDEDGLRTSKKKYVNNVLSFTENYVWVNDKIVAVKRVNSDNTSITVRYLYDADDELFGFVYNNKTYFYIKNPRGDIGGIINADDEIAYYAMDYDAWGNVTYTLAEGLTSAQEAEALHIREINNFTYRGYFYDSETNLYYLQSRYYDPEIGRFINADDSNYIAYDGTSISINLFAFCFNNPIHFSDYSGYYVPSKAKAYAENWWCMRNSAYKNNDLDHNCANFVSQCLYAGELSKMTTSWYNSKVLGISSNWGKANNLYKWLKNNNFVKEDINIQYTGKLSDTVRDKFYNKKWCIAVIFFDWDGDGKKDHAALSGQSTKDGNVYDLYYYAHSIMRNGRKILYYPRKGKPYYCPVSRSLNGSCRVHICILK